MNGMMMLLVMAFAGLKVHVTMKHVIGTVEIATVSLEEPLGKVTMQRRTRTDGANQRTVAIMVRGYA